MLRFDSGSIFSGGHKFQFETFSSLFWPLPSGRKHLMKLPHSMSVYQFVSISGRWVNSCSQKRLMELLQNFIWSFKGQTEEAKFSRKILIFEEQPKNSSQMGFFGFCQKFNLLTFIFTPQNSV